MAFQGAAVRCNIHLGRGLGAVDDEMGCLRVVRMDGQEADQETVSCLLEMFLPAAGGVLEEGQPAVVQKKLKSALIQDGMIAPNEESFETCYFARGGFFARLICSQRSRRIPGRQKRHHSQRPRNMEAVLPLKSHHSLVCSLKQTISVCSMRFCGKKA